MPIIIENSDRARIRSEIEDFAKVCKSYYNGELSIPEYKSQSGGFGTYSERGHKTGMLRLRITFFCIFHYRKTYNIIFTTYIY